MVSGWMGIHEVVGKGYVFTKNSLKDFHWCHYHFYISHKAAKSMAKLISQLCGESQSAVMLAKERWAIQWSPEHSWMPDRLEKRPQ